MAKKRKLFGNVHPAVIAVWAALIASAHLLPAVVLIGVGGTMSVSTALLPLAGIFFGPLAGMICAAIGQFIGFLIAPSGAWLGMFTWLIGTCTATIAGLLSWGYGYAALPVLGLGIVLWFTQKIGRSAWLFAAVFGGYGAVCMILATFFAKRFLMSRNVLLKAIAIFLCGVAGMVTAAMLANFASLVLFKTPAISWKMLVPVSPVERTMFSLAAMIVGVPLLIGLPKIGIFVGPQPKEELEEEDEDEAETTE